MLLSLVGMWVYFTKNLISHLYEITINSLNYKFSKFTMALN
jgi:hypothetical protein